MYVFEIFPWEPYQILYRVFFFPTQTLPFALLYYFCPHFRILSVIANMLEDLFGRGLWNKSVSNLFHFVNWVYRWKLQNRWKKCYYRFVNSAIKDLDSLCLARFWLCFLSFERSLVKDGWTGFKVREELAYLYKILHNCSLNFSCFVPYCPLCPIEVQCSGLVTDSNMPKYRPPQWMD